MVSLAPLLATITLDASGLQRGLSQAQSSLSRAGSGMTSAGTRMSLGITAPLLAAGAASVNLAAKFDTTMRQVGIATGGATGTLEKLALTMGAKTAFSAGDAADAMLELAKGGMTAAQIQGGALEATMTAAAAGGISLADASTLVSNSMATFNLKTREAGDVAVALAGAANASSASMSSLQQGLSAVGGVAASAGLSLQETVATLSAFDAQGLKGSDAGTSLKSMLNSLIPTTDKAKNAMSDLGLNFVNANGEFDSMTTVAGKLHKALGPLPAAQRSLALETIFGADGMRAANALTNTGAAGLAKYLKATRDTATTQKLANSSMEGLSGAIEKAKGSLETAGIVLGQTLAPAVVLVAGYVERAANAFSTMPGPVKTAVVVVAALAAALGPVLIVLGMIASGVAAVSGAMAAVSGAFAAASAASAAVGGGLSGVGAGLVALVGPVALVVAAVAAIAAGLVLLYTRSATVRGAVAGLGTTLQAAFAAVLPIVMQVVAVFQAQLPQIAAVGRQAFSTLVTVVRAALAIVQTTVKVALAIVVTLWRVFGSSILGVIRGVMSGALGVIRGALNIIQGVIRTVLAVIRGDWSGAWKGIQQILRGVWQVIQGVVRAALAVVKGAITGALSAIKAAWSAGWNAVVTAARAALDRAQQAVKTGVTSAVNAVKDFPTKAKSALGNLGNTLFSAGADLINGLINGIASKIQAAVDKVKSGLDKIKGMLPGSPIRWGPLKGWNDTGPTGPGGQLMGNLAAGIDSGAGRAVEAMRRATAGVKAAGNGARGGWTLAELQGHRNIGQWRRSSERDEIRGVIDQLKARVQRAQANGGDGLRKAFAALQSARRERDALRMDVMDVRGRYVAPDYAKQPPPVAVNVKVDAPQAMSADTLGGMVAGKVAGVLAGRGSILQGAS